MNRPKVSIIVPVYNVENYLQCCIDSLLNQTLKDIEIILVDDGSPDNCPAICDEYARQDHRIKVIHKKNAGQGYARNSGLEIAAGEYVTFVDSDDYVELSTYQNLYSIIMNTKVDIVYFSCQRFDDHGNTWMDSTMLQEILYRTEEKIRGLMLDMISNPPEAKNDRDSHNSVCTALFCHDIIKRYGLRFKSERELNGGEDLLFNFDCLLHSSSVLVIPDTFYNYRVNLKSFSRMVKPDSILKNHFFYQCLSEMLKANNFGEEGYLRATRHFIGNTRNDMRLFIQLPLGKTEKMQWMKEVSNYSFWKEIASLYPYKQLPLKQAVQFYLLYKGYYRLLYYLYSIIE